MKNELEGMWKKVFGLFQAVIQVLLWRDLEILQKT
jgi:hypothetical protein